MTQLDIARFQDADKYSAYLRTTEGKLRLDLGWIHLREFLAVGANGRRALDVGGGSGVLALRLAEIGFQVDLLDHSSPMLALARQEAHARGLSSFTSFHHGDAARLQDLFDPSHFHVVVCHNLLEYMEEPLEVLRGLAHVLKKDEMPVVSVLVRNRCGEVLKAAIQCHDGELARTALAAETVLDSLYGGPVRVFDPAQIRGMMERAGLEVVAERGVRVLSDYLYPNAPDAGCERLTGDAYRRLLDLESLMGAQPQLAAVARYTQIIARPIRARPIRARVPSKPARRRR